MYTSFYGLKEKPFNVTPDPQFLYLGEKHREALAHLIYGVKQKKGFMVITGEVGTGKTTLIRCLLAYLNSTNGTKAAFLFNPKLGTADFIRSILRDLGLRAEGGTKGDSLHSLYDYLLDEYEKGERVILIVDEAQGLSQSLLEEIRLLSNLETSKSKLLQILLVGQPELNETLSRQEFRQIRQRINMHYHLTALSEKETQEYIEKRLQIAGTQGPLFTQRGIKEIYRNSRGIPRLINILCDNSLLNGYASEQDVIGKKLVREAARDLKLGGKFPKFWLWVLPGIVIIGSILSYVLLHESGYWRAFLVELLDRLHPFREIVTNEIENFFKFFQTGFSIILSNFL
jgi:general secretion pathway protein A